MHLQLYTRVFLLPTPYCTIWKIWFARVSQHMCFFCISSPCFSFGRGRQTANGVLAVSLSKIFKKNFMALRAINFFFTNHNVTCVQRNEKWNTNPRIEISWLQLESRITRKIKRKIKNPKNWVFRNLGKLRITQKSTRNQNLEICQTFR